MTNVEAMILACHKQRTLTGKPDAGVSFVIPGKWPANNRKRLDGKKGPLGQCICEYENAVLCIFKSDEVITYLSQFLPVLTIDGLPTPQTKVTK